MSEKPPPPKPAPHLPPVQTKSAMDEAIRPQGTRPAPAPGVKPSSPSDAGHGLAKPK